MAGRDPKAHRLYAKYQAAIHNDLDPFILPREEDSKMKDKGVESESDDKSKEDEVFPAETKTASEKLSKKEFETIYQLCGYDESQIEKIYRSYSDYYRFLCSSPLPDMMKGKIELSSGSIFSNARFEIGDEDTRIPYGSYHQQYLINDKFLIAVGVIDVLPACISSVYAFYDPIVSSHINLGKLTALYEIDWVKHVQRHRPNLKYYYLGYYIHSCQKMRYKAEYKPSDILCPVKTVWVDYEVAKKRLESRSPIRHCCNLSTSTHNEKDSQHESSLTISKTKEGKFVDSHRNSIRLNLGPESSLITVEMLTEEGQSIIRPILEEFMIETGFEVARRCVIKLF